MRIFLLLLPFLSLVAADSIVVEKSVVRIGQVSLTIGLGFEGERAKLSPGRRADHPDVHYIQDKEGVILCADKSKEKLEIVCIPMGGVFAPDGFWPKIDRVVVGEAVFPLGMSPADAKAIGAKDQLEGYDLICCFDYEGGRLTLYFSKLNGLDAVEITARRPE